jgi:hypothetical protein
MFIEITKDTDGGRAYRDHEYSIAGIKLRRLWTSPASSQLRLILQERLKEKGYLK